MDTLNLPTDALRIDAIGTKRFDSQTGADREVQRILLELLNQMDAQLKFGKTPGAAWRFEALDDPFIEVAFEAKSCHCDPQLVFDFIPKKRLMR